MKKILLFLTLSISILFGYSGYYAPFEGSKYITQGWNGGYSHGYGDSTGSYNGKKLAFALDIAGDNFSVLAVKDGEVVKSGKHSGYGNYVMVKHNDGLYSFYAHLSKIITSSGNVKKGVILGKSGNTGTWSQGSHLHFQMQTTSSITISMADTKKVNFQGFNISFVDKINIASTDNALNRKLVTSKNHAINSLSSVPQSYFDGAGSVIDNSVDGIGGQYDVAKMHPHSNIGWNSTVVFQWRQEEGKSNCKKLGISADRDIGDVIIRSKYWSSTSIEDAFKVKLGITPITLSNNNDWTTLAVTTTKPLSSSVHIYAECQSTSNTTGQVKVSKDMVDVGLSYFWSGTGSIISRINKDKFGTKKDYATTNNGRKSFTSFQWDSTNCKKLGIYNGDFDSTKYASVTIDKKKWNSDGNSWERVCNSLPCVINEYNSQYYILKIKSEANAVSMGNISVKCK